MRLRRLLALCAGLALVAVLFVVPASGSDDSGETATYVVQLIQAPLAGYDGGVAGYAATKPAKGKKLDASSDAAKQYAGYLNSTHDSALDKVGGTKIYDYTTVFNGFAATLTAAQAAALEGARRRLVVEQAQNFEPIPRRRPSSSASPPKTGSGRSCAGRRASAEGGAGEDIIIGIIDSGFTPESLASRTRRSKRSEGRRACPLGPPPAWPASARRARASRRQLQQQADRRALLQRRHGRQPSTPSSTPRATTTATARTPPAPGGNNGVPATGEAAASAR